MGPGLKTGGVVGPDLKTRVSRVLKIQQTDRGTQRRIDAIIPGIFI